MGLRGRNKRSEGGGKASESVKGKGTGEKGVGVEGVG